MWSWKKPATPKQETSKPASSAPSNLPANYRPEARQSAGEEAAKLDSRDAILPPRASTDPATSWVGSSLYVKGEISGEEDLLVDGSVDGRIELGDRNLTIGTTAKVMADIIAGDVVVYGEVSGNVRARGRIEVKKEASVTGDLTTPQILIEDGACFKGTIEIEKSAEEDTHKDAFPPAA